MLNAILTIDLAIAFDGVAVRFANKNLVFLGTSTENGYDPLPFATGTCAYIMHSFNENWKFSLEKE